MNPQMQFGIVGAILGLVVGLIGGIAAGVPFGIILLRSLLALILAGAAGFALSFVIKKFLPELMPASDGGSTELGEDAKPSSGTKVDITLEGDGDQAEALRDEMQQDSSMFEDPAEEGQDSGIMEEVAEDAGRLGAPSRFDENAFYQGIDQLPDIGGFSEQFQSDDQATASGASVIAGSGGETSRPSNKRETPAGNMDPALVAQAIRTKLLKEDT